ncbi:hypothetical protein AB0M22_28700 [Nocardia sp. NPDC051756]
MGIFRKTTKPDEQPADSTDKNTADAEKNRKLRRRLLGGYYGTGGI